MNNKAKIAICACLVLGFTLIVTAVILSKNEICVVTFDTAGGSSILEQSVKKGEKVNKPVNPTKEDYTFLRWEYQNSEYDFSKPVEKSITLKAIWEKIEENTKKYKLTFKVDGKEKEIEVSDASEIDVSALGFSEKDGYTLTWYVNGKVYDLTTPLTEDMSIEGKYEKAVSYVVKFNSDGGTAVAEQKVNTGGKATEPKNVTKEGYILDGWYLNNKKYNFNDEVTKNITLVAKWTEDPSVKRYTVTFDSAGGSNVASQKVIENKTATQPANPTKAGHAFDGWYLNNTKYNFSTKVTADITLVARWRELATYTVTFDSTGGSNVAEQTVTEGNKATKPANPTRSGYTFKEWQLNGSTYTFNNAVTANITLTAVWTKDEVKYTVSFNSAGGSSVASQQVVENGKATRPSNPTRSGYTFMEWQLNGNTYDFNTPVTGNITLVAVWDEIPKNYTFTVSLVDDQSPDRIITVYEEGTKINFAAIIVNGTEICTGANPTVNKYQIQGKTSITVRLTSGKTVTATLV